MSSAASRAPMGAASRWGFVILMLGLTALFVTLGVWQLNRLAEKETLIAAVETRAGLDPAPLPPVSEWQAIDPETFNFRPTIVTGTYVPEATVQVFTSLTDAQGPRGGAGYWLMTPLVLENNSGLVWINRGFIPQDLAGDFRGGADLTELKVTVAGLARKPDIANSFTPAADLAEGRDWVRDPERLSLFLPETLADLPVAPITLDRFAGEAGELPQGGETVMTFSNRHLEYAGTWFAFALVTPIMLGFWFWRHRKG